MDENWLFEDPWHALATAMPNAFKNGELKDILAGKSLELAGRPLDKFQTSSGKLEFSASAAPASGPLPMQLGLTSGHDTFLLLNSAIPAYTHSQFTDVYGPIPEIAWINPRDAAGLDIDDGMVIGIYNDLGCVTLKAKVTADVLPGTLWAPRPLKGLNGQPLNVLTPGETQKIGGGPVFNSIRVKIRKEPT